MINLVAASSRWTNTTSVTSTRNISPTGVPSPEIGPAGIARPAIFASPGHIASLPSTGSTVALWRAKRGSRFRSSSFRDPGIDPNLRCPPAKELSIPEILGEPSARMVAIVLCRPASKRRSTTPASTGSTALKSPQNATSSTLGLVALGRVGLVSRSVRICRRSSHGRRNRCAGRGGSRPRGWVAK